MPEMADEPSILQYPAGAMMIAYLFFCCLNVIAGKSGNRSKLSKPASCRIASIEIPRHLTEDPLNDSSSLMSVFWQPAMIVLFDKLRTIVGEVEMFVRLRDVSRSVGRI
jgi:hypothetical protein